MFIRFCLCFGMGCAPSMLSENNRNRKNSDLYTTNGGNTNTSKSEIIQDSTKCNQILVNPYQGFTNNSSNINTTTTTNNKKNHESIQQLINDDLLNNKKDSIVSVTATGHIVGHIIPTVRRSTISSK